MDNPSARDRQQVKTLSKGQAIAKEKHYLKSLHTYLGVNNDAFVLSIRGVFKKPRFCFYSIRLSVC